VYNKESEYGEVKVKMGQEVVRMKVMGEVRQMHHSAPALLAESPDVCMHSSMCQTSAAAPPWHVCQRESSYLWSIKAGVTGVCHDTGFQQGYAC
jgi:hypothetical protein